MRDYLKRPFTRTNFSSYGKLITAITDERKPPFPLEFEDREGPLVARKIGSFKEHTGIFLVLSKSVDACANVPLYRST